VPRFFEDLDGMLSDREYLAGDTYTVADITAFVTVEFAGWLKLGLTDDQTNAKRWYEAVKARPSSAL
jgi:glutathione S-transferase